MQTLRTYIAERFYECRPDEKSGIWYVHWTEERRSKRKSLGARNVREARKAFDTFAATLKSRASRTHGYTCSEIWHMKYGRGHPRAAAAWAHLGPVFGIKQPKEVTQMDEDVYRVKRGAEVAGSTLRLELSLLRATWNHAVRKRVLDAKDVPVLDPLPEASPPRQRILDADELARLFQAAERPGRDRVRMFIWLARYTAARRTAIEELRWNQVRFDTNVINYLPDGERQTRKRKASVPIASALRPVLEEAYARRKSDTDLVIGAGAKINHALDALARAAGVEGVTPHVFRHTAATEMVSRGVDLWVVAKVLGNTVEQVENVYAKWRPGQHRDAVDLLGRVA
jgi:integrase